MYSTRVVHPYIVNLQIDNYKVVTSDEFPLKLGVIGISMS